MADNLLLNDGTGSSRLATDETTFGSPSQTAHIQVVKLAFGALDSVTLVENAAPFPIKVSDGTDVLAISGAGAASVELASPIPAGTNNIGDVDVLTMPATAAEGAALPLVMVVVAGDNGTGTPTIPLQTNAGGDLKITLDSEAVVLGAGGAAIGTVGVTSLPDEGQQTMANSISVAVASDQSAVPISGTVTANQGGTWNINNVSGTVSLPTGAATAVKQPALGIAGTPSVDVITVQGIASMTPLLVDGSGVIQPVSGTVTANLGTIADVATQTTLAALNAKVTACNTGSIAGTVTANIGTTGGIALDATLTGGTTKAIARGAAKGVTPAADATVSSVDADHNAVDVWVRGGGAGDGAILDGVSSAIRGTVFDYTNSNPLAVRLTDTAGDYVSAGGGTQYAEDSGHNSGDLGTMALVVRTDSAGSLVDTALDYAPLQVDQSGQLKVALLNSVQGLEIITTTPAGTERAAVVRNIPSGTQAVSGTVTANLGTIADVATQTTLAALNAKVTACNTGAVVINSGTVTANAGTGTFTVGQGTPANLLAQVSQPTAASLNATVVQGTAANLLAQVSQPTAANLNATVVQATAANLKVEARGAAAAGTAITGNPVLVAGSDGTNVRTLNLTTAGTVRVDQLAVNGSTISTGNGGVGAGVQRVTLANDSTGTVALKGDHTTGGTTPYYNNGTCTETALKGSGGQIYWIHAMNLTSTPKYLQLFNATTGTVVPGTTTPTNEFVLPTQGNTNGAGFALSIPNGLAYGTAITFFISTAKGGGTAATANDVLMNVGYA